METLVVVSNFTIYTVLFLTAPNLFDQLIFMNIPVNTVYGKCQYYFFQTYKLRIFKIRDSGPLSVLFHINTLIIC